MIEKYYEDKKARALSLREEIKDCSDSIVKIIDTIYDAKSMMPEDARKNNVDIKVKDGVKELRLKLNRINQKWEL